MSYEINMTHKFNRQLTEEDKKHLGLVRIETDFITFVCDDGNGEVIFELPFYVDTSYPNEDGDIEIHLDDYNPEESDTDEFDWYWAPYVKEAYHGDITYYARKGNEYVDITEKMYDYLTDKYGAHAADDHFVDCIIYNQETGEELDLPKIYHD